MYRQWSPLWPLLFLLSWGVGLWVAGLDAQGTAEQRVVALSVIGVFVAIARLIGKKR